MDLRRLPCVKLPKSSSRKPQAIGDSSVCLALSCMLLIGTASLYPILSTVPRNHKFLNMTKI